MRGSLVALIPMPAPLDPQLRGEYLARLRREIEASSYETPEKLGAALDQFLDTTDASCAQPAAHSAARSPRQH